MGCQRLREWYLAMHQAPSTVLLGRTGRGQAAEDAVAAAMEGNALLRIVRCDAGVQEEAASACVCSRVRPLLLFMICCWDRRSKRFDPPELGCWT